MAKEIDKIIQSKTTPKSKNVLWDNGENLKINRKGKWESIGGGVPMLNVKYAELVDLRNNNKLIAGMQYRITDYVTTTSQEKTQSAGHQFDVIVLALTNDTLAEEAWAALHEGDTYFSEAGANLAAWQIWYSLDNDIERFSWAKTALYSPVTNQKMIMVDSEGDKYIYVRDSSFDSGGKCAWLYGGDSMSFLEYIKLKDESLDSNDIIYTDSEELKVGENLEMLGGRVVLVDISWIEGKGIIYRMIDEWNNDCPYDFKNIQFLRGVYDNGGIATEGDEDMKFYLFTFSWRTDDNEIIDTSIFGNNGRLLNDESRIAGVYGNVIGQYIMYDYTIIDPTKTFQILNDIVFYSHYNYDRNTYYGCYSNSFGNNCYSNSFGDGCMYNTFFYDSYSNSFGNDCQYNSFWNNSAYNNFNNNCIYNNIFSGVYGVGLNDNTLYITASINSHKEIRIFNLADLADLLNS